MAFPLYLWTRHTQLQHRILDLQYSAMLTFPSRLLTSSEILVADGRASPFAQSQLIIARWYTKQVNVTGWDDRSQYALKVKKGDRDDLITRDPAVNKIGDSSKRVMRLGIYESDYGHGSQFGIADDGQTLSDGPVSVIAHTGLFQQQAQREGGRRTETMMEKGWVICRSIDGLYYKTLGTWRVKVTTPKSRNRARMITRDDQDDSMTGADEPILHVYTDPTVHWVQLEGFEKVYGLRGI